MMIMTDQALTLERQIYVDLLSFKTISFHHQGQYFLRFYLEQPHAHCSMLPANGSRVEIRADFCLTKIFQISFNDELIPLNATCFFKLNYPSNTAVTQLQSPSLFKIELFKLKEKARCFRHSTAMGRRIASASLHINHFEQPKQQIAVSLPFLAIEYFGDLHLSVIQTYFGARLKKGALSIPGHLSLDGQVVYTMLIQNKLKEYANLRNTLEQYAVSIPELTQLKKTKPLHEHYKLPLSEIYQLIQKNAEVLDSLLQIARNRLIDLVKGWTVDTLFGVIKKQTHNRYQALKSSVDGQVEVSTALESLQMYPEHEKQQPRLKWHDQNFVGSFLRNRNFQPVDVLIVMVHGFGGNSLDFQRMKSNIILQIGSANFLSLTDLKEHIQEGILSLGLRAAKELISALKDRYKSVRSISLIGFSLGGLILRAMLPHLSSYGSRLNMLITFGSPHLGLTQLTKWQTQLGVYLLTRINRSQSIRDLCLDPIRTTNLASSQSMNIAFDHDVFSLQESSILSDLASCQELSHMNCVVMVASERDEYVPSYSALAAYKGEDKRIKYIQAKMEQNMPRVVREMYEMDYQENFFDSITLKKRHLCLLQNQPFLRHFFAKYAQSLLSA